MKMQSSICDVAKYARRGHKLPSDAFTGRWLHPYNIFRMISRFRVKVAAVKKCTIKKKKKICSKSCAFEKKSNASEQIRQARCNAPFTANALSFGLKKVFIHMTLPSHVGGATGQGFSLIDMEALTINLMSKAWKTRNQVNLFWKALQKVSVITSPCLCFMTSFSPSCF